MFWTVEARVGVDAPLEMVGAGRVEKEEETVLRGKDVEEGLVGGDWMGFEDHKRREALTGVCERL